MHFRVRTGVFCLLLIVSQLAIAAPAKRKKTKPQPPPEPVQQAPEPPKPPPTPEEMPAVPPHVSMQNGMMTITADNSTMGDILNAVKRQTGAVLELPPGLSSERVAARLGPGKPESVIQQLFVGSRFDYIIVGSPQDPSALQKITVTPRGAGGATVASNQPMNRAPQPPAEANDATDSVDETPEPEPAPPEAPPVTPPTQAQPYSNQPKTPEQLLQELQQMQQQQQQGGRPPRSGGPQAPPQPE